MSKIGKKIPCRSCLTEAILVIGKKIGVTAGFRRMFQALGVLDRYPAVPSVSR